MKFEFATAQRILFGEGTLADIGAVTRTFGRVCIGRHRRQPAAGGASVGPTRRRQRTDHDLQRGKRANRRRCRCRCGGGKTRRRRGHRGVWRRQRLDAGKAIAALATNPGDVFDYLEVIGKAQPLANPSLPVIAIPTTAGTGSEVTRNAVLASPAHRVKVSVRSPSMLPRVALVDPELTYSLPPAITAATGMDALTQLIEPFTSSRANPADRRHLPRGAAPRRTFAANCGAARSRRSQRGVTWPLPACAAGWRWPTPGWARCTVSPGHLAGCTAPARRHLRGAAARGRRPTCERCGNGRRRTEHWRVTTSWRSCSQAAPKPPSMTPSPGCGRSSSGWRFPAVALRVQPRRCACVGGKSTRGVKHESQSNCADRCGIDGDRERRVLR
jgi:hypothetical protein